MAERVDLGTLDFGRPHDSLALGWHASVARALGLDADTFQLLCGATDAAHVATRAGLSALADRLPSQGAVAHVPAPGRLAPRFSDAYRRLLGALMPESEVGLRGVLGEAYPAWVSFRNKANPDLAQRRVFSVWAHRHLSGARRMRAIEIFDRAADDAVSVARDRFGQARFRAPELCAQGRVRFLPDYGIGPDDARAALIPLRGGGIRFDSQTVAAQPADCAPRGALSGRMLPAAMGRGLDPLEARIGGAGITIDGEIGARALVPVEAGGWYDRDLVARATAAESDGGAVWDGWADTGRWSTFFGAGGLLRRVATHLVFVSGARLTLTVHGRFTDEEREELATRTGIPADAPGPLGGSDLGGIWPFPLQGGRVDMHGQLRFDVRGNLTVDLRQSRGTVQCWGARVDSTGNFPVH